MFTHRNSQFLYGRAGYLYGALLLNRALGSGTVPHQNIQYITDALLRSGASVQLLFAIVVYLCSTAVYMV